MNKNYCLTAGLLLVLGLTLIPFGQAAAAPLAKGEPFPAITLPIPKDAEEKNYLGLTGSGVFKITQVKAQALLIEIFSMYCPYCQKDAPRINELFQAIERDPELKGRIKILGLGAGNSAYEVGVYKKTYNVPFPLIPDERLALHQALGETRTPYFILVRLDQGGGRVGDLFGIGRLQRGGILPGDPSKISRV